MTEYLLAATSALRMNLPRVSYFGFHEYVKVTDMLEFY